MTMLKIEKLTKHFEGVTAVSDLDLNVNKGEILGLIGPNGAGKTTIFNIVSGFISPTSGRVVFNNEIITGLRPDQVARKGLVRTFQLLASFTDLTVLQNVIVGLHMHNGLGFFESVLSLSSKRRKEKSSEEKAMQILEFIGMADRKDQLSQNLSYGWQKTLALGVSLATEPELLLLDEPLTGISPSRTSDISKIISSSREKGITIVLIEHNMREALGLCDRIVALDHGVKLAEGLPEEVKNNKEVIEAYLGT